MWVASRLQYNKGVPLTGAISCWSSVLLDLQRTSTFMLSLETRFENQHMGIGLILLVSSRMTQDKLFHLASDIWTFHPNVFISKMKDRAFICTILFKTFSGSSTHDQSRSELGAISEVFYGRPWSTVWCRCCLEGLQETLKWSLTIHLQYSGRSQQW